MPAAGQRERLGPVGAFLGATAASGLTAGAFARDLESAGWPALWTNEVIGADALVRAALWLAQTERLVVGTCIANVWARPAQTAHAAAAQLSAAHPGRFVLGIGVGRDAQAEAVGRRPAPPVRTARDYLEAMPAASYPRILAANGPRLLALAGELADGALPAGRPPSATAHAREALGPEPLLVVYVPFTAGDPAANVAGAVAEHRAAGADHVIVGLSHDTDRDEAVGWLRSIAAGVVGRG